MSECGDLRGILSRGWVALRGASALVIGLGSLSTVLVLTGAVLQTVSLNYWLTEFPGNPGPFTVLISSYIFYVVLFGLLFVGFSLGVRSQVPLGRWLPSWRQLAILVGIGIFDAVNGVMSVYATPNTPEILQPILLMISIVFTMLSAKYFLRDPRQFLNFTVGLTLLLIIGGAVVSSIPYMNAAFEGDAPWIVIFTLSALPGALYNVLQAVFMEDSEARLEAVATSAVSESNASPVQLTVKLQMLFLGCFFQLVCMCAFFPVDFSTWFGSSPSASVSWSDFTTGMRCVVGVGDPICTENTKYFLLFNLGYTMSYIGAAFLNHFSPNLCAMIAQLASPLTVLVLAAVPKWNINQQVADLGPAFGAAAMMIVATLLYFVWEEANPRHPRDGPSYNKTDADVDDLEAAPGRTSRRGAPTLSSINHGDHGLGQRLLESER